MILTEHQFCGDQDNIKQSPWIHVNMAESISSLMKRSCDSRKDCSDHLVFVTNSDLYSVDRCPDDSAEPVMIFREVDCKLHPQSLRKGRTPGKSIKVTSYLLLLYVGSAVRWKT